MNDSFLGNKQFFTIITPVFNRESIVAKTIESVLAQEFKDFEYILIDDCSTDNTFEVLQKYAAQDERINSIRLEENKGRCYARNTGLKNASGNWICYLDSDDLYYPNHLSVLKGLIESNTDFFAFAVDQNINGVKKDYRDKSIEVDNVLLSLENFIEDNPFTANQICHSVKLKTKWSNERIPISEDWLFFRTLSSETPILKKATITNNLREHNERTMTSASASSFVENNLKAAKKFINENNCDDTIKNRIMAYTSLLCCNVYLQHKEKKAAWSLFTKCWNNPKAYSYTLFYKAIVKFILP